MVVTFVDPVKCSCGILNNPAFVNCWKCGNELSSNKVLKNSVCPDCKGEVVEGAVKCKNCGSVLGIDRNLKQLSDGVGAFAGLCFMIGVIALAPFWLPKVMVLLTLFF